MFLSCFEQRLSFVLYDTFAWIIILGYERWFRVLLWCRWAKNNNRFGICDLDLHRKIVFICSIWHTYVFVLGSEPQVPRLLQSFNINRFGISRPYLLMKARFSCFTPDQTGKILNYDTLPLSTEKSEIRDPITLTGHKSQDCLYAGHGSRVMRVTGQGHCGSCGF